jgi:CheY-like chemotaxis protein
LRTRPRILFVDDHEDTRTIVATLLGMDGYEVTASDSVADGLKQARAQTFDLYLLDSRFADGSGKELCEKLRDFDPHTPIIFYTGDHPKRIQEETSCDVQGYVMKPYLDALPQIIKHALRAA